jgi:hypothetical protein
MCDEGEKAEHIGDLPMPLLRMARARAKPEESHLKTLTNRAMSFIVDRDFLERGGTGIIHADVVSLVPMSTSMQKTNQSVSLIQIQLKTLNNIKNFVP